MNKKSKLLMGSIATIAMCTSLVVGGTYALFTDKSEVNVAVSSGKVDVKAYIDRASVKTYSAEWNTDAYEIVENAGLTFATDVDGTPSVVLATDDNKLTIAQMVAGDKVTFDLVLENLSDVKIQYQTVIKALNDTGLFQDLDVTIGEAKFTPAAPEVYSNWLPLAPGSDAIVIPVEIAMPLGDTVLDEDYWNNLVADQYANSKSCEIAYSIRAVQGNAHVVNPGATDDPNEIIIDTVSELYAFAQDVNVNGNTYAGKTVYLGANLDLAGAAWTPIGTNAEGKNKFYGTFDGQNYEISNLYVNQGAAYHAAGLFGGLNGTVKNLTINGAEITNLSSGSATTNGTAVVAGSIYGKGAIENVTVKNAKVSGNRYVAGISGYTYGNVKNCTVENIEIVSAADKLTGSYDNGDKAGGIVGYFASEGVYQLSGNTVKNAKITGYRDIGGIAGYCATASAVVGNSVDGLEMYWDNSQNYKKYNTMKEADLGAILGEGAYADSNSYSNTAVYYLINGTATIKMAGQGSQPAQLSGDFNKVVVKSATDAQAKLVLSGESYNSYLRSVNNTPVYFENLLIDDTMVCTYSAGSWEFSYNDMRGVMTFTNCDFVDAVSVGGDFTFVDCTFDSLNANKYAVWVDSGKASFEGCIFGGYRGLKVHEAYGSEVDEVVVNGSTFVISAKPGIALGTLNADTTVAIEGNKFINCKAGDQNKYIYESDTAVNTFNFVEKNNVVENTAGTVVASSAAFNNALGTTDEITVYGTVSRSKAVANTTVKGAGAENSEIVMNPVYGQSFGTGDVKFEDITITNTSNALYAGFYGSKSEIYTDCVINGQYFTYGEEVVFENCTFVQTDANNYNIWTYGAKKVTFINCTFNSAGKAVLIYNEGADLKTEVTFEGCTFNASAPVEGKAAIEIDSHLATNGLYTVNINDTKAVVGFAEGSVSGNTLWNNKNGVNTIVNVDSVRVF